MSELPTAQVKRCCVTGGLGFIGSHLTDRLIDAGAEVTVIDDMSSNAVDARRYNTNALVITAPVSDHLLRCSGSYDHVFHLAAPVGPVGILGRAGFIAARVVRDTQAVRDYCLDHGATLINVSTSEIYGHAGVLTEGAVKQLSGPYTVRNEYAAGKLAAEVMLANTPGLRYQTVRPFNVTGPRQRPDGGFALPRFAVAALTGQPLTVYGTGRQMRTWTHVADVCEAVLRVATYPETGHEWNVGNEANRLTILELADLVRAYVGSGDVRHVDPVKLHGELFAEAADKVADSGKLRSRTGWSPAKSVWTVVSETVNYWKGKVRDGYYFDVMSGRHGN